MQCVDCDWLKSLEDSGGDTIYFCMQKDSPGYLEMSGICGNCDWAGYQALSTLYHVTLLSNAPAIQREGLQPKIGERAQKLKEESPAIFLFSDRDSLEDGLANWLGDEFEEMYGENCELAILEIKLPVAYLTELSVDPLVGYETKCSREIPPDYITFLDEQFQPLEL